LCSCGGVRCKFHLPRQQTQQQATRPAAIFGFVFQRGVVSVFFGWGDPLHVSQLIAAWNCCVHFAVFKRVHLS
jgi:hypothetical protein